MARPRKFDEQDVLQQAMLVFWRNGYEATTYKMLETATGVGARGLVNVFGDKDALFTRVLGVYQDMVSDMLGQIFADPSSESIANLFREMVKPAKEDGEIANAGCLMVNTVFETGRTSAPVRSAIERYRELCLRHFKAALRADGIPDASAKSEFLLGVLWGVLSHIRLTGSTTAASPMANVAIDTLASWHAASSR